MGEELDSLYVLNVICIACEQNGHERALSKIEQNVSSILFSSSLAQCFGLSEPSPLDVIVAGPFT